MVDSTPDPRLQALEPLVGTWAISGDATGETSFAWMEGGHFLVQRGRVANGDGPPHDFVEMIGFERGLGDTIPADDITSRVYTTGGDTLDYCYEPTEGGLTIWGGAKGSPAAFRGRWSEDGDVLSGAWSWPGGGYTAVMTRIDRK